MHKITQNAAHDGTARLEVADAVVGERHDDTAIPSDACRIACDGIATLTVGKSREGLIVGRFYNLTFLTGVVRIVGTIVNGYVDAEAIEGATVIVFRAAAIDAVEGTGNEGAVTLTDVAAADEECTTLLCVSLKTEASSVGIDFVMVEIIGLIGLETCYVVDEDVTAKILGIVQVESIARHADDVIGGLVSGLRTGSRDDIVGVECYAVEVVASEG